MKIKTDTNRDESPHTSLTVHQLFAKKKFRLHLAAFVVLNVCLFLWMFFAHSLVRFDTHDYSLNAYHYIQDSRTTASQHFNLLDGVGQYDSQFFLRIAGSGYSAHPKVLTDKQAYAFSPLFPALVASVHTAIPSIELSAFVVAQIMLIACFIVLYWFLTRWYSFELAAKTTWLLFLLPFSIFYRSYYSEGAFLLFLILFLDAIRSKKWYRAAIAAGLLSITRFIGITSIIVLACFLVVELRTGKRRPRLHTVIGSILLSLTPLILFMFFCYQKTGNSLYFIDVRSAWRLVAPIPFASSYGIIHFWTNHWHYFHSSRIDTISILISGFILFKSRRWLPRTWWFMALLLWAVPLLITDTMSASRYQIVNLPLFIYAAFALPKWAYRTILVTAGLSLFLVSLYFINWYWVG